MSEYALIEPCAGIPYSIGLRWDAEAGLWQAEAIDADGQVLEAIAEFPNRTTMKAAMPRIIERIYEIHATVG